MQSLASGEAYYERCWAGLFYVTVALAPGENCRGGMSFGGFFCAGEENDIREAVGRQLSKLRPEERTRFLSRLSSEGGIRETTPATLRGLGLFLLEATLSSGINSDAFFKRQQEKYLQQREIAQAFEDLRSSGQSPPDLLGDTFQLMAFVHGKDRDHAMRVISRYLARLLMMGQWSLRNIKAHARVLLAVMTSRELVAGADWTMATTRESQFMQRLMACESTEDCCLEIANVVLEHFSRIARPFASGGTVSERAERWLRAHYAEPVTLARLAREIGASVSSVVHELKKERGKTSRQLLREIRIEQATRLLATTDMTLSAVGEACGFFDQSHFSKAFKRAVNLTPGQFRRLLHFTEADI